MIDVKWIHAYNMLKSPIGRYWVRMSYILRLYSSGQVDGFTAAAVKPTDTDRLPVTVGQTFIWGNVLVNIQGGYDVSTGMLH